MLVYNLVWGPEFSAIIQNVAASLASNILRHIPYTRPVNDSPKRLTYLSVARSFSSVQD
jgi:hypothetical protein